MPLRTIVQDVTGKPTIDGAGVRLVRVLGSPTVKTFDPFLMLDAFDSQNPDDYTKGFPMHPHRGIETFTYLVNGAIEHKDSLGNEGVIGDGDCQWMTAGSGIIHQEMPVAPPDGRMHGFQLWANLPREQKMMDPRYRDIKVTEIPVVTLENGVVIRMISDSVKDIVIEPEYLDVTIPAGETFVDPVASGHTCFAYVFEGSVRFCRDQDAFDYDLVGENYFDLDRDPFHGNHSLVVFGDGDAVQATAGQDGARFLLISGKPLREPVAWHGPIVMNTEEELRTAFREYQEGTFIK